MKKPTVFTVLFLPILFLVACGSDEEEVGLEPTLPSIQANIFDKSCTASSCHGDQALGGLDLRSGKSFSELVNVEAQKSDLLLVKPGAPDESFLITKLTSPDKSKGEGDMMPLGGRPLSSEKINAIRTWIDNGAKK